MVINGNGNYFFFKNKISKVIQHAKAVLAGNEFLATYARKTNQNVFIVPTVVDPKRYTLRELPLNPKKKFTIGWIGSPSTSTYVKEIAAAIRRFCKQYDAELVLVGSGQIDLEGIPLQIKEWSEETELDELYSFDVGIMPLTDGVWTRGKCGFKLIQYMACGLPVVASPIGVNQDLVKQGISGFLASSEDEWFKAFENLYQSKVLRDKMGVSGRKTFEELFSLEVFNPIVAKILKQASITKIKVVHVVSGLNAGGTEMMLFKLLSKMSVDHFENTVISLTDSTDGVVGNKIRSLNTAIYTLSMRSGVANPMGALKFIAILYRIRPHILQTWLYHSDLLGALAFLVSPVKKLCWNIRCSFLDFKQYSKTTEFSVRVLSKLSSLPNAVLVNSRVGQNYHESLGYHPRRWELIPNGFDLERFSPDPNAKKNLTQMLGLPENSYVIGMVARFDPMKDHSTFIRAAEKLLRHRTDAHFILIGKGVTYDNPAICSMFSVPTSKSHIHLLGERTDIAALVAGLDIFSLSSRGEGFPNVIGEAMACGVPCVVTNAGDSAEIVGNTGRIVPVSDPDALAEAWEILIQSSPESLKNLGDQARKRIENKFNLPLIVKHYENLYRNLLDEKVVLPVTEPAPAL